MKNKKANKYKWLEVAILVWTFVFVLAITAMAANPSTYSCFELSATSSGEVLIDQTTTGWSIKAYGTDSSCDQKNTETVTFTIKNTDTARAVTFDISVTSSDASPSGAPSGSQTLAASGSLSNFTATSGAGSEAFTTIDISITNIVQESTGANVTTTVIPKTGGTITVDGTTVTEQTDFSNADDHTYTLTATAASGYTFFGWMSADGALNTDGAGTLSYAGQNAATLWPLFVESDSAMYWIKGTTLYYAYLDEAITAAGNSGTVVVHKSGTAYHSDSTQSSFTVSSGVTLLIPYDSANTLVTNGDAVLNAYDTTVTARSEYRALTMASGAKITVADGGAISVSSGRANQFIGQVGPYGAIYMNSGSNITVQSGGTLYVWGYIFHGTDNSGTVTVESGGTVYEPISIMDYPGSSSVTTTLTDAEVFPMRSYSIRNVEVPMTINSGAKEYVFTCLYGSNAMVGTNPLYVLMIANGTVNGETPVFQNSGTITKSYVDSRMCVVSNGNLTLNALTVEVTRGVGSYEISSSATSGFYLPSCWDFTQTSGILTINDNVIICEGCTFTINQGATADTNGKNIYVLDADNDPGAVVNSNGCGIDVQNVHGNYYTNVPNDAVLDINGTLIADGGFYTSAAGACITSSKGGGKVQVSGTSTSTSVNVKKTNDYAGVTITAAKLKNEDDSFVETANATEATTYTYVDGFWRCGTHSYTPVTVDPTCTEAGSTTYTCSVCGHSYSEPIAATGHSYTPVVTDPTCTEQGYTTYTCACGDSYVSDITASLGHEWQEDGTCVRDCVAIASVNGQMYLSVAEALEAVPVGGTIKLLYAPAATDTPAFNKSVTVNKNGLDYEIVCADGWDDVDNGDDTWTVQKVSDGDKFHIYAANVNMGNNLDMLFAIPKDAVTDWTGHYVQIVRTGSAEASEDETVDVKFAEWVENGSFYIITYGGFDAKEMCDSITLTVYNSEGTAVSYPWTDSIRAYAMRILGSSKDDQQKTVVVDMLNFGAAVQEYFSYGTDKLASALLTDAQKAMASKANDYVDSYASERPDTWQGSQLVVTSQIQFLVRFSDLADDMKATVTFTGHKDNEETFEAEMGVDSNGNKYFAFQKLVVADARYPVTITVNKADGTVYATCTDSIEAYVSRKAAESPVFAAFMKFADSAHIYKHGKLPEGTE